MNHQPAPIGDDAGGHRLTLVPAPSGENADQRPRPTMDVWERQQLFREMAARQIMNGTLSRHRRKAIVQYAAVLGINAALAGRLLEQARRLVDERSVEHGQSEGPPLRIAAADAPSSVDSDGSSLRIACAAGRRPLTLSGVLIAVVRGVALIGLCLLIKSFM
ncbi:MAG: hypothetical protein HOP29_00855 [Phycisphaerales bacterium]|nr:hypothetical protein [Phycisphaerales bacterium]